MRRVSRGKYDVVEESYMRRVTGLFSRLKVRCFKGSHLRYGSSRAARCRSRSLPGRLRYPSLRGDARNLSNQHELPEL